MLWTATAAAVISTLALTLFAFSFPTDLIAYALAVVVGITNAILWIMWGELYSRTKTSFSVKEPQAFLPSHPPPIPSTSAPVSLEAIRQTHAVHASPGRFFADRCSDCEFSNFV